MRQAMTAHMCNHTIAATFAPRMAVRSLSDILTNLLIVFPGNAERNALVGLSLRSCSTRSKTFDTEQPLATNRWARYDISSFNLLRFGRAHHIGLSVLRDIKVRSFICGDESTS